MRDEARRNIKSFFIPHSALHIPHSHHLRSVVPRRGGSGRPASAGVNGASSGCPNGVTPSSSALCTTAAAARFSGVFVVRPGHNPIGPFDFGGVYDEASDRQRTPRELIQQGYDDAYQQFIEPVVAAGERLEEL